MKQVQIVKRYFLNIGQCREDIQSPVLLQHRQHHQKEYRTLYLSNQHIAKEHQLR
jgi:hypothetical protein